MESGDFVTSWAFLLIMAGLLCFFVLLIPILIVCAVIFVRRADRDNRDLRD